MLVYTHEEEIIYKIKVKHDFHRREAESRSKLKRGSSLVEHESLKSSGLIEDDDICEEIYRAPKDRNINTMFVVEQELGLE